jgi:hypothetical protein
VHAPDQAYRAAGRWIEPQIYANRNKITRMEELVTVSCTMLAFEVLLWIVAVTS